MQRCQTHPPSPQPPTQSLTPRDAAQAVLLLPASSSYDLWSAGCVIYEAATGSQLFDPQPGDGFTADEQHLWQIKQLLGQPPLRVGGGAGGVQTPALQGSSAFAPDAQARLL